MLKAPPKLGLTLIVSAWLINLLVILGIFWESVSIFSHFLLYSIILNLIIFLSFWLNSVKRLFWRPELWRKITLLLTILQAIPLSKYYLAPGPLDLESPSQVTILSMNIKYQQKAAEELERIAKETSSDIVIISETNEKIINGKFKKFPHSFFESSAGLYILSQKPLSNESIIQLGGDRKGLQLDIHLNRRQFRLITCHLSWPIYAKHYQALKAISDISHKRERLILVGDFNSSPWSAPIRNLLLKGDLKDTREGNGISSTWHLDANKSLGLIIDHMFYRGPINSKDFKVIQTEFSDHNALLGTFMIGGKFGRKSNS